MTHIFGFTLKIQIILYWSGFVVQLCGVSHLKKTLKRQRFVSEIEHYNFVHVNINLIFDDMFSTLTVAVTSEIAPSDNTPFPTPCPRTALPAPQIYYTVSHGNCQLCQYILIYLDKAPRRLYDRRLVGVGVG